MPALPGGKGRRVRLMILINLCFGMGLAFSWVVAFAWMVYGGYIYEPSKVIALGDLAISVLLTAWFVFQLFYMRRRIE